MGNRFATEGAGLAVLVADVLLQVVIAVVGAQAQVAGEERGPMAHLVVALEVSRLAQYLPTFRALHR